MKKSNLIKLFSVLLISVMVLTFSTNVLAATEDDDFQDLSSTVNSNSNKNNTNTNTNKNNTNTNTNKSNTNTNNTNKNNTNNNGSIYNNTNLPKTGIEDSIPVAMLVVVFGISAVYAYKKIRDYKNI